MSHSRRKAAAAVMVGSVSGGLIAALQTLVLMPLYLREIGVELYGAWCGSGDLLVWLQLFDFGLPNIMIQRIGAAHGQRDRAAIGSYLATGMLLIMVVALVAGVAAFLISSRVPHWMGVKNESAQVLSRCFLIGAAATVVTIVNHGIHGLAKGIQDTVLINVALVVGSAFGFVVTAVLLLSGWGLYSIAWGMVVRALVMLVGNTWFLVSTLARGLLPYCRIRTLIIKEMAVLSPPVLLAGVSYGVMNNSQAAIAAITLGPAAATILTVTRRAMDLARYFSDVVAYASYGGFASLVASAEGRSRAMRVRGEVIAVYMFTAIPLGAACVAINPSFVAVWVGTEQFGGVLLSLLLSAGLIATGWAFLSNYLYRATGKQAQGAFLMVLEALVRVPAMALLALLIGLEGLALAGVITATVFGWIAYSATSKECGPQAARIENRKYVISAYAGLWGIAAIISTVLFIPSWIYVLSVGAGYAGLAVLVLLRLDPWLADLPIPGRERSTLVTGP